ncbi:MAG: hypothetical protein ABIN55_08925, partial [Aeromicrobium sp.]
MSITRPDARLRPVSLLATMALLVCSTLSACTGDSDSGTPTRADLSEVAPQMERILQQRARALKKHDEQGFLATVDRSDQSFVDQEMVYFANLVQLPVGTLSYGVDESSVVRTAGGYDAVVEVQLQLDGYDEMPVVRPARFHFTGDAEGDGLRIASDRDLSWEQRNG